MSNEFEYKGRKVEILYWPYNPSLPYSLRIDKQLLFRRFKTQEDAAESAMNSIDAQDGRRFFDVTDELDELLDEANKQEEAAQ